MKERSLIKKLDLKTQENLFKRCIPNRTKAEIEKILIAKCEYMTEVLKYYKKLAMDSEVTRSEKLNKIQRLDGGGSKMGLSVSHYELDKMLSGENSNHNT
ncbi:MAG: hypothetical protein HRU35_07510 [Rickettsiaceae bacterium]|nr:hypothetical protein [Rickettsiaceae bacterium]